MILTKGDLEKARRVGPMPDPVEFLDEYLQRRSERLEAEAVERARKLEEVARLDREKRGEMIEDQTKLNKERDLEMRDSLRRQFENPPGHYVSLSESKAEKVHPAPSVSRQVLYHQTTEENAASITANGFNDGITSFGLSGVWLSGEPLWFGRATLIVLLSMTDRELSDYELIDDPESGLEPKEYREWLIPAEVIASYGTVYKLDD